MLRIREFILDPASRYRVSGAKYRHILDEGDQIDEDRSVELVYTNGKHIAYNDSVWRIPSHFKEPKCLTTSVCDKTNNVIVDILVV